MNIDSALGGVSRPFGRKEGTWSFGPTGRRLWATYIDSSPGFSGLIEYIHKTNIPSLFHVSIKAKEHKVDFLPASHIWYPSRLEAIFQSDSLELREIKLITDDDCALDVVTLVNVSGSAKDIELVVEWPEGQNWDYGRHGAHIWIQGGISGGQKKILHPGEKAVWVIGSGFGLSDSEAERALKRWLREPSPVEKHVTQYQKWFDGCPEFKCGDEKLERLWAYRWFLLRRNIACPGTGRLKHPVIYEGRGYKMTMDPWRPQGWEFSKLIPFSTPFHLLEGRWHPDVSACKGSVLALVENQAENGLFPYVYIDQSSGFYTNFLAWAVWQFYLVHPDRDWLEAVAPGLQKELDATLNLFDPDDDGLPQVEHHGRTGKEYQPSFFFKTGYPKQTKERYVAPDVTPLERVDFACYVHMNASALNNIWNALGNIAEAERCSRIAARVKSSVLSKMWNSHDAFFYDIAAENEEQIPVKQVVGYDPFLAGIASLKHIETFKYLKDSRVFDLAYPVSSVEKLNPAYAPNASWMGIHVKGEHGAMWNGPTWPFTNSTVLMALANASRLSNHWLDNIYADLFRKNSSLAFAKGEPNMFEHYNPETGQPISEEEHYLHSSWIDLVVSHIAGIIPREGKPRLNPINCGLECVSIKGLPYRGSMIDING